MTPGGTCPPAFRGKMQWKLRHVISVSVLVAQLCLTLCNPMDSSSPGFFVHGILQARILEWVAIPSLGDLPDPEMEPGLLHCRQILYLLSNF